MDMGHKSSPLHRAARLAVAAVASCAVVACGRAGPGNASPGPRHPVSVGVNTDITWGIAASDIRTEVKLIKAAGMQWIRASVDLSGAEYQRPGRLNEPYIRQVDAGILAARAAKLNVLLQLDRTPYWASADPRKYQNRSGLHWNDYWGYKRLSDYAHIAADVVRHYATMGVQAYEIWSEPNYPSFWPSGVNAAAYTRMIRLARDAIKAVDPRARIVMGGLSPLHAYQYLGAMYRAGARGLYDVANFHLYPNGNPGRCVLDGHKVPRTDEVCALGILRSEMLANHDRAPAWVTELGWSTCRYPPCVTQQQQASYLPTAIRMLGSDQYSFVKKAFVYEMRDLFSRTGNFTWGGSLGVVTRTFVPKLAYAAVKTATAAAAMTPKHAARRRKHRTK